MLIIQQTAVGDYRQSVLEEVADRLAGEFMVLAGQHYFDESVRTRVNLSGRVVSLRNFFLSRKFLWQHGGLVKVLRADKVILELNPRILNVWLALLGRRLLGKESAVWGHAWTRRGASVGRTTLRDWMCRLAGRAIAYTESDAKDFANRLPGVLIFVAPNALYRRRDMYPLESPETPGNIVMVGRLVAEKKPVLLLSAFRRASERLPASARLVFVGEGPEAPLLRKAIVENSLEGRVDLMGHVGELEVLRKIYARAIASVSAGYVGLSIIQSHAFGVPMIYANNEPHAPEIEAARDDANAIPFASDSVEALADALVGVFDRKSYWLSRRNEISRICAESYSVERMADGLLSGAGYASAS